MILKTKKISKKKGIKNALLLFIIIIFLIGGGFFGFNQLKYKNDLKLTSSEDERIFPFEIEKGEKPKSVANKLLKDGFVVSDKSFLRFSKKANFDAKFQAGKFYLPKNLTIPEIAEKLTKAFAEEIKIVIPEGFTLEEIDARLTRIGLIEENEFLDCVKNNCNFTEFKFLPEDRLKLEGYFFPATYSIIPDQFNIEKFSQQMLGAFSKRIETLEPELSKSKRTLSEIVIMASILEKETRTSEERPIVADIFWRRLDTGMTIGADATVRYFTGKKTEAITVDDLLDDNPFNTRKHKGLTPHAICNPGMESLKSTLLPEANDFWYFLHDSKGNIHYAKTLDEHNKNKREYIK